MAADFAHVFDVKSGTTNPATARAEEGAPGQWTLRSRARPARPHRGDPATAAGQGRPGSRHRGLAAARRRAGGGDGHGHGAARLGRRSGRPRAPLRARPWGGDPRADRLALVGPLGGVARPAVAGRRRPGARRSGGLAHRRRGAPRPRRRRRRGSVVHDAVRSRLAADGLDDVALRRIPRRRGARQPGRPPGHARTTRRPRSSPAASCTSCGATAERHVLLPQPLLRHRGRHAALRRPRRRGLAVAGDRRGHPPPPGPGPPSRRRLDDRTR